MIDEAIATFTQGVEISLHDKEIAIEEEAEKITTAVRHKVISIENISADVCASRSDELKVKKSEVAPSVVNSFDDRDWEIVIQEVKHRINKEEELQQAA